MSMSKIEAIYQAAVEINDLSEKAGFSMRRCMDEPLSVAEQVEQVRKAKGYFERMLTEILAFEVRDFDALIKALEVDARD